MYGKSIKLTEDFMDNLCEIIKNTYLRMQLMRPQKLTGISMKSVTQDAIGADIRPTIMVRERSDEFITNFNISDHDFAVNIDDILLFKEDLKNV